MNAPRTLYRHPEARGVIVADPANLRLIVCNEQEDATATVSIGPAGLRALADKLRELADSMGGAQ